MALWMVRAGKNGEHEQKFLNDSRVYLTWKGIDLDLAELKDKEQCRKALEGWLGSPTKSRLSNALGQIHGFAHGIRTGDLTVLPSKLAPTLHFGVVKGAYEHHPEGPAPYFHSRSVEWTHKDVPRTRFDKDLLYSFGAFMAVCRVWRHDAENRVRAVLAGKTSATEPPSGKSDPEDAEAQTDFESLALVEIADAVIQRFKGHGLQDLVAGILRAQGYRVLVTPPGSDRGVDLLASRGPLGFEEPRICVQVKSGSEPADIGTLLKLKGSMVDVGASHGLLVSWSGFKSSVKGDTERKEFFNVRLWSQDDLIRNLLDEYERLDPDLRAELPLKRIWTLALV